MKIAIHGGAGTLLPDKITPDEVVAYHAVLEQSLQQAYQILKKRGSALQAVTEAVEVMEDSELFNAGKGSVFTHEGTHEMDAAIMCGHTLKAGAVSGVSRIKNPIRMAEAILQDGNFVMLSGSQAEEFAQSQGIELVHEAWFSTDFRRQQLIEAQAHNRLQLDHTLSETEKFGTVGAVALDAKGNLASATSTGGITNKRYGRIGDTPLIGCGTYANHLVAISATGWGEFFIRSVAAYDVAARMMYGGEKLAEAAVKVLENIKKMGGDGGLIAIDNQGNVAMPFITPGMYRGMMGTDTPMQVKIFKD